MSQTGFLGNFGDENTLQVGNKDLTKLLEALQNECEMIISFKKNLTCFKTNGAKIIPEPLVTSLGIETDEKINFDKVSNDA